MNIGSLAGLSSLMVLFGRRSVIIWLILLFFLWPPEAAALPILGVDRLLKSIVDGIEDGLLSFWVLS